MKNSAVQHKVIWITGASGAPYAKGILDALVAAARRVEEQHPVWMCAHVPIPIIFFIPNVQPAPVQVEAAAVLRGEERSAIAAVVRKE